MKSWIISAAASALLVSAGAAAQDISPIPPVQTPEPMQDIPIPPSDPETEMELTGEDITDAEIASFAAATVRLREERDPDMTDDARLAQAESIVAEEGLDPARYSAIARAAQADPAIAMRIRQAADAMMDEVNETPEQ
ncbi:DUF4168 domain-containing protein [Aurantiacibacter sediminis]|uniref:DUF4168 domain-containing protein n=1 Tax=Aurantiacibacter sediminis TaxID=2793064 RepID=A0ABS0MZH6_9SPHN|nr:DUF4168 domain-containing protein [Aurantiacibacter sediminis]MBH5321093.1 DUF4168 domain-containing protein [Aurantiacibacter sediminis]